MERVPSRWTEEESPKDARRREKARGTNGLGLQDTPPLRRSPSQAVSHGGACAHTNRGLEHLRCSPLRSPPGRALGSAADHTSVPDFT